MPKPSSEGYEQVQESWGSFELFKGKIGKQSEIKEITRLKLLELWKIVWSLIPNQIGSTDGSIKLGFWTK